MTDRRQHIDTILEIVEDIKKESFVEGYKATNEEAMGLLLAHCFGWDGLGILKSSAYALEDANFHKESQVLFEMIEKLSIKK